MNDRLPPAGYGTDPVPTGNTRRLKRSRNDKVIAGVAGGLADYFGLDSTWVRIAFVASIILPGPQVLLYAILWAVIPKD